MSASPTTIAAAVAMVATFTVAQGDRHFSVNVNLTPDISTAQYHRGLQGMEVERGGGGN